MLLVVCCNENVELWVDVLDIVGFIVKVVDVEVYVMEWVFSLVVD